MNWRRIEDGFRVDSLEFILRDETSDRTIIYPSAVAIGYIPQISFDLLDADSVYRHFRLERRRSRINPFKFLFAVGNPTPEDVSNPSSPSLGSLQQTLKFADTQNFRALIVIDSLRVIYSDAGKVTRIEFDKLVRSGYTRMPLLQVGPFDPKVVFEPGTKKDDVEPFKVREKDGSVSIEFKLKYKIGELGDWIGKKLTGKRAPYAHLSVVYTFKGDALTSIGFIGSHIPSVSMYVNWRQVSRHDMLSITADKIGGFLGAEHADAPFHQMSVWRPELDT